MTAYKHALVVNPDLEEAHLDLISVYGEMNYRDEVLAELNEVLRCNRKAGRKGSESQKDYAARILDLEETTGKVEKDVAEQADRFEVKSAGMPVFNKAEMAWMEFGLAGKALSILLSSDVAAFGRKGMALELELLLHTGRVKDVREWPDPQGAKDYLGAEPYLEMQVQLEAASGNYQLAEDHLQEMLDNLHIVKGPRGDGLTMRGETSVAAARTVIFAQPYDGYIPALFRTAFIYPSILQQTAVLTGGMRREADLRTLRGMLAVESGAIDQARKNINDALALWGDAATANTGGGLDFPARPIAQDCQKLLDKAAAEH